MNVPTEAIIYEYMRTYLKERGHTFRPLKEFQGRNKDHYDYQREVCQSLIEISNELREFIMRNHHDMFKRLVTASLNTKNQNYTHFKALADSLFAEGISWVEIVTFLTFGAELACKAINDNLGGEKENTVAADDAVADEVAAANGEANLNRDRVGREESCDKMVSHIIKCFSKYIDENLMQWIQEQDDGWMSIKKYTLEGQNCLHNKGMRYYFRMATFAAFVGGLYFCSKFILQK